MKIVFLHTHFDYLDGSTRFLLEMCRHLKLLGHSVTVLCLNVKHNVISEYVECEDDILAIGQPSPHSLRFWLQLPFIQRRIKETIHEIRPDSVIANIFPCQYFLPRMRSAIAMWYCHEPSAYLYRIQSIRNLSEKQRIMISAIKGFLSCYDKRKVSRVDKIACNSCFTANEVQRIYRRNAVVIYPGVDTERFRPITMKKDKPKILLSVGPLLKSKRLDLVLDATRILLPKHHDFRVIIAGDGPESTRLIDLADILDISNFVEFRRCVPENNLVELYSEATAVVYPSMEEPFGLVPLEAMACGTPVIACRTGGTSETIIDGETGFLIDPYDLTQLVEKIGFMLSNPTRAEEMGLSARKHVMQKFSWLKTAKEISELCELHD